MARVLVYIWFDVEDYVTPEADEPPKRIIETLSKHDVKATVKVVAEKVRALKERRREDVITALSTMDVGYHLDTHSRHPTLYEYLADKDVKTGAAEFLRRERDGYDFVRKTFNTELSCFGHPGPTWAPQVYPALQDMGIRVYLDETSILNLDDSPYWYCNVLNLNGAGRNFINLDYVFGHPDGLEKTKNRFKDVHKRLRARRGAVSILFHPHTIVNSRFWDEVNFAHGRNPTRDELVRPPSQPPEVTERAYRDFEEFVKYMKSFDGVEFITARDATSIFQDLSPRLEIDHKMLSELAQKTVGQIRHQRVGEAYLSPAEIFDVTTKAIATYADLNVLPAKLSPSQPLGPLSKKRTKSAARLSTRSLLETSGKVLEITEEAGYIPSEIVAERSILIPEDYLATVCSLLVRILRRGKLPEKVALRRANLAQRTYVNSREFAKACKWIMLPEHLKAERILEQALLQTWTLKPAIGTCLLYTSPSPRDRTRSRMPSSA